MLRDTYTDSPIAVALMEYKAKHALTNEQLANQIGISRPTFIAITKHGKAPELAVMLKLARLFEWTAHEVGLMTMWPGPPVATWRKKKREEAEREKRKRRRRDDAA